MMVAQALQYPLRGKGSFRRILILALIQLLPIVGQLILLGYGIDIVLSVYGGQTDLPPIRWLPALSNGLRFFLAGLGYLLPILITIGIVVGTIAGANNVGSSNMGVISILVAISLPLLVFLIHAVIVKRNRSTPVQQPQTRGRILRIFLGGLLPILVTVMATFILSTLVSLSGIKTGKPNGLSILLFALLALLIFLIWIVLCIGGVRYALENKGLLAPMTNAKLLLKNRTLTTRLLLNVILLAGIAVVVITIGLLLFILPGLCLLVICSLALWYLFAQYSISAEMPVSGLALVKNSQSIF